MKLLILLLSVGFPMLTSAGGADLGPARASGETANLYLPKDYSTSSDREYPVVFLLHGYGESKWFIDKYFGFGNEVSKRGFILVVPPGLKNADGMRYWNASDGCCDFGKSGVDDVKYLDSLLADVIAKYRVDRKRVFAAGHSNGAFMAHRWACETSLGVSGVVSLAGVLPLEESVCHPRQAVSVLQIHAVDDETIKFNGDPKGYDGLKGYPGAVVTAERWAKWNQCESVGDFAPLNISGSNDDLDTHVRRFGNCADNATVELWTMRAYKSWIHSPHTPLLKQEFTERVLDFLQLRSQDNKASHDKH
jgi:polyhydroxybutyrate depolymerase